MDIEFYFKAIRFYFLAALYIFVVFGSIYGFFIDQIVILNFSLTGWSKNLLCLGGLLIAGLIPAYPVLLAVYRALNNSNKV